MRDAEGEHSRPNSLRSVLSAHGQIQAGLRKVTGSFVPTFPSLTTHLVQVFYNPPFFVVFLSLAFALLFLRASVGDALDWAV